MILMAVTPNALGLTPALPTDSARACLHLKSGTLELTAESQRTLAAFISFVSPIQKVLSVDVSYSRTVSGSNLEDPPFISEPMGTFFINTEEDKSGRMQTTRGQLYGDSVARSWIRKNISPVLADAAAVSLREHHSTAPTECDIDLGASGLFGPRPAMFRTFVCTPDRCGLQGP
jgi:hypothetical protein